MHMMSKTDFISRKIGYDQGISRSYDSFHSKWISSNNRGSKSVCKGLGYVRYSQCRSSKVHQQCFLEVGCVTKTDTLVSGRQEVHQSYQCWQDCYLQMRQFYAYRRSWKIKWNTLYERSSWISDELFLHFSFKSSDSDRFSIIYMIRIRFFRVGRINSENVPGCTVHWPFTEIRRSWWRSWMQSFHVNTSSTRNKWHCRKSSEKSQRRHFIYIASIWTRWAVVGRIHGMFLPFTLNARFVVRWLWRTLRWSDYSISNKSRKSSDCSKRSGETPSVWQESIPRLIHGLSSSAKESWTGDLLGADIEEFREHDASDVCSRKTSKTAEGRSATFRVQCLVFFWPQLLHDFL